VGYALAALVTAVVYPKLGWRFVFFLGAAPALLVFWIQSKVEEPAIWRESKARGETGGRGRFAELRGRLLRVTVFVTLMNAFTMFGYWGFNLWIPGYLSLAREAGGMGYSPARMPLLVAFMQIGTWLGYLTFGYISDALGRKSTYRAFLAAAAGLVLVYSTVRSPLALFLLGPFVAFFGTGYFAGFGALTAELYPTRIRATLQGFTYNIGRVVSAAAPLVMGSLAQTNGFGTAFLLVAASFLAAAVTWFGIPETRGRELV
jgi:MFS family permease